MADQLPSRDKAQELATLMRSMWGSEALSAQIVEAYASGRLVDREDIDYGRLMAALDDVTWNFRDSWDFDFFVETVKAALGGTRQ